ncbi:hypothetical protein [Mesorhizobium sp. 131-3-5]|uniref:hypothetical protein n=1 Tax=Mesorhizobium sp. 131-3-5 TaxID=2744520 RepID=UPI00192685A3|nr:hypothetical protein [Mesorhizobium sp. 131-3-5]
MKMLARSRHHLSHDAAQPDQVAHGFMIGVGHPDGGQLSSPMKAGKHGGVATVRLHPIARLPRNQRRNKNPGALDAQLFVRRPLLRNRETQRLADKPRRSHPYGGEYLHLRHHALFSI